MTPKIIRGEFSHLSRIFHGVLISNIAVDTVQQSGPAPKARSKPRILKITELGIALFLMSRRHAELRVSRHCVRCSGWNAGAAKSKKARGALLPIVPNELQPQYWQSFLVPFGRYQGRLAAVLAVRRCATMVRRARPARFRH
jgi:hypothetical protein